MNTNNGSVLRKPLTKIQVFLAIIIILVLAYVLIMVWPKKNMATSSFWMNTTKPLVFAHQGGAMERPSSTNVAFEHCAKIGVDVFELDVALTNDDVLVTIHDLSVDRTTDGKGLVRDKTYAEVRFLDAGYGLLDENAQVIRNPEQNPYIGKGVYIPSLEELFINYPQMPMLIEVKDKGKDAVIAAKELLYLIEKYDRASITTLAAFEDGANEVFDSSEKVRVIRSASMDEATKFYVFNMFGLNALNNNISFNALDIPTSIHKAGIKFDLTSASLRKDAAKRNISIRYWTINNESEMHRLVDLCSSGGVNAIMTDKPSTLMNIIK